MMVLHLAPNPSRLCCQGCCMLEVKLSRVAWPGMFAEDCQSKAGLPGHVPLQQPMKCCQAVLVLLRGTWKQAG